LNVFSFGANLVTDSEKAIDYLRGLKNKLEVLKMAENNFRKPGQSDQDYKLRAIEYLKKLKYLDYEVITQEQREAAKAKYTDEVQDQN